MLELILAISIGLFIFAATGLKIVPQSQRWVVTRLGRYHESLDAGVNFIIPFLDSVHSKTPINDQVIKDITLEVVSRDNVVYGAEIFVVFQIFSPRDAVFRVNDVRALVEGLVRSLVRSELGKVELDQVQSDRSSLNQALLSALEDAGRTYGVRISRTEITDVRLGEKTQEAMAEVLSAERSRRAAITRAEGERRAAELAADAKFYEAQREAEAIRAIASATADSNKMIAESLADGEAAERALAFQVARLQVAEVGRLAVSDNAKLIMLPGAVSNGFTEAAALIAASGQGRS